MTIDETRVALTGSFNGRAMRYLLSLLLGVGLVMSADTRASERSMSVPALGPYVPASGISGTLTSTGSDTLDHLMTLWSEGFRRHYPEVTITHESKSSSAAAPALVEGTAELGLMSRKMEESEIAQFEAKFGYRPTPYAVAVEALAVYVHKDNPIEGLNMEQVEAIFAKSPRYGYKPIAMWGQLYLDGEWSNAPIHLYGRRSASGTYEFFKEEALRNGDFRDGVKEQPDASSVVQRVAEDRYGLGYGGLAYVTPGVRALALADSEASPFVVPTMSEVKARRYPLRRYLYVYVNQKPRKLLGGYKPLPPLVREFLRYVYSREGQAAVLKDGYFPVEDWMVHHALATIK